MRIALIGPVYPYRGGIAHYTTMLYRALCERGHDVLLISFKRQYPDWLFPGQSDKDPSQTPLRVENAQYWIDSLNPFTWLLTFFRILHYKPDAMIMQWWTTFWAPAWLTLGLLNAVFLRNPLLYICHNVLPHEQHWWDKWLARLVLRWGKRFIVQSVEEWQRLRGCLPNAQATVLSLPVFDEFMTESIPKDEARKLLGLSVDTPVLLFFGIVRAYKGLLDLLSVLPRIRDSLGKVVLLVVGEFWEDKGRYIEMIESLDIVDSVVLEDRYVPNEEVGRYFSATDLLVAPYREVTGSAVVQMGIGFNCPIIATRVGSLGELAVSEPLITLVEPQNDEALVRAITQYFRDRGDSLDENTVSTKPQRSVKVDLAKALEEVLAGCV